jgi:peptidoglycan/xylan/chitin deacetylase (PgdA/CDA1 family)
MITELVLLLPLYILVRYGVMQWYYAMIIGFIYYWLPKWLILSLFMDKYYPEILCRNQDSKYIALTFDDVPYGSHEQIIQLLNKYDMKATFFVISDYVNLTSSNVLIDAIKHGHQLGNHGSSNSMHAIKTMIALTEEIHECDTLIKRLYSNANVSLPKLMVYRPGCGLFHNKMLKLVKSMNYHVTLGSVYPNDPIVMSSFINYHYVKYHLEFGDIVILHDRKWTINMLENLLKWMTQTGYKSITVNELVNN